MLREREIMELAFETGVMYASVGDPNTPIRIGANGISLYASRTERRSDYVDHTVGYINPGQEYPWVFDKLIDLLQSEGYM